MRSFIVLASLVVFNACAESQPPPPTQPRAPTAQTADPTAMMQAQAQAEMQAARERAVQQQAAVDAVVAEAQRKAAEAADPKIQRAAAEAPIRKKCAETRADRVAHAKEMIVARMDAEARLYASAKAIRASCKLTERKTGAVNVSHGVAGWRAAPEVVADVQCGQLPKGITKHDAWVVLARDREGTKGPSGSILDAEDTSPDDGRCIEFDAEVGVRIWDVTFEDSSAIERLNSWKPPSE